VHGLEALPGAGFPESDALRELREDEEVKQAVSFWERWRGGIALQIVAEPQLKEYREETGTI
jgi:hypothetical protein